MKIHKSLIPGAGKGVFAKRDYEKGEIVGEYYGDVVENDAAIPKKHHDYLYEMDNGKVILPWDQCKTKYINDAIGLERCVNHIVDQVVGNMKSDQDIEDVVKKQTRKFIKEDEIFLYENEEEGTSAQHNLRFIEKYERVFLKTRCPVEKGEEFYVFYGWGYWKDIIIEQANDLLTVYL